MQSALLLHLPSVDIPQKGIAGRDVCGFCLKAKMSTSAIAITKQIKPAIKILLFFICLFAFALLLLFGIFS
jgi:hypothetical protein